MSTLSSGGYSIIGRMRRPSGHRRNRHGFSVDLGLRPNSAPSGSVDDYEALAKDRRERRVSISKSDQKDDTDLCPEVGTVEDLACEDRSLTNELSESQSKSSSLRSIFGRRKTK